MQTKKTCSHFIPERGFTLAELITVMLIIGIMAVIAVPRFTLSEADAIAESNALKAALRYAQTRAMSDTLPWGLAINAGGYTLQRFTTPVTTPANIPGETSATHSFASGVTAANTQTVRFDYRGRPISAAGAPLAVAQTVTISGSGETITITPQTGFVP